MTGRTGKHFRGDKDLMIHDKTGRVNLFVFIRVTSRVPLLYTKLHGNLSAMLCDARYSCLSFLHCLHTLLFADSDILEPLCKVSERSF